ncbi:tetratricopeptide repeat protein (plasmid) [Streptomyces sp. BI20]|uniref:tetratricopeptide repeat protein n=1 Tax=Streptomyces sp. BI20 TaxID=3403460 RepID=UPI003C70E9C2
MTALRAAGEYERALEVLEPYLASGGPGPLRERALVWVGLGRVEEALESMRSHVETVFEADWNPAQPWVRLAEVAAAAGRMDEVIGVLAPRVSMPWCLSTLVELTEGQGVDEEVLGIVTEVTERMRHPHAPGAFHGEPWNGPSMWALVLERMGCIDEAITLLKPHAAWDGSPINVNQDCAELILRQEFVDADELSWMTSNRVSPSLWRSWSDYFERVIREGRQVEAEAALRASDSTLELLGLLSVQGRFEEAADLVRNTDPIDNHQEWYLVAQEMADAGRADLAIPLLDEGYADYPRNDHGDPGIPSPESLLFLRWWALAKAGRVEDVIALRLQAPQWVWDDWNHPDVMIAEAHAMNDRLDEAITLLYDNPADGAHSDLIRHLVTAGRADEAFTLLTTRQPT